MSWGQVEVGSRRAHTFRSSQTWWNSTVCMRNWGFDALQWSELMSETGQSIFWGICEDSNPDTHQERTVNKGFGEEQ